MKSFLRFIGLSLIMASSLASTQIAHAVSNYTVSDLSAIGQSMIQDLVKTTAVGTTHRAYMPANPMGYVIGLDVGIEATAIRLPNSFKDAVATASGKPAGDIPALIPLPKLNLHKGLPFGVDFGLSYVGYQDKFKVIGGDVKWAFTDLIPVSPVAAALRLNYTSEKLWYINASNFQTDLLVSKNLLIIEPYVGTGLQFWSGSIEIPTGLPAGKGLPASVSGNASGTNAHFFAGMPLKLAVFWITPEVDYSTAGITTFGSKFSFNF